MSGRPRRRFVRALRTDTANSGPDERTAVARRRVPTSGAELGKAVLPSDDSSLGRPIHDLLNNGPEVIRVQGCLARSVPTVAIAVVGDFVAQETSDGGSHVIEAGVAGGSAGEGYRESLHQILR